MQMGYTYANPQYRSFPDSLAETTSCEDNIITYRNRHTFKSEGDITLGPVTVGTSIQYYSFMECIDEIFNILIPGVAEYREANSDGDWIWDLRATVDIGDRWTLAAIVKNVMNNEYAIRPARIDAPRNYTLRLDYVIGGN